MILNLTPHDVDLILPRRTVCIPASGRVAELDMEESLVGTLLEDKTEVPVLRRQKGRVRNLPLPADDVWLIVSTLILEAAPERDDLLSPHNFVRDHSGRIIGCRSLTIGSRSPGQRWAP